MARKWAIFGSKLGIRSKKSLKYLLRKSKATRIVSTRRKEPYPELSFSSCRGPVAFDLLLNLNTEHTTGYFSYYKYYRLLQVTTVYYGTVTVVAMFHMVNIGYSGLLWVDYLL